MVRRVCQLGCNGLERGRRWDPGEWEHESVSYLMGVVLSEKRGGRFLGKESVGSDVGTFVFVCLG